MRLNLFVLQFEDFGKSETEVREHMVQLANFLDSVSRRGAVCSALLPFVNVHLGVCSVTTLGMQPRGSFSTSELICIHAP